MNSEHGIDAHTVIIEQKLTYKGIDVDEVIKMNNDLKCCGNCSRSNCLENRGNINDTHSWYCYRWEWDYLRREDRIIEKPIK